MTNMNLEQMHKDLQCPQGYSAGPKMDKLVTEFCELNSKGTMNVAGLTKFLSMVIHENYGDGGTIQARVRGLQVNFQRKKEIIEELRTLLAQVEQEVVFQEESLGSYSNQIKPTT